MPGANATMHPSYGGRCFTNSGSVPGFDVSWTIWGLGMRQACEETDRGSDAKAALMIVTPLGTKPAISGVRCAWYPGYRRWAGCLWHIEHDRFEKPGTPSIFTINMEVRNAVVYSESVCKAAKPNFC